MSDKKARILLPVAAVVVLLLLVAAMAGFFTDKIEPGLADRGSVATADGVAVTRVTGPFTEPVPASVEARQATIISSRLLARIVEVTVRAGDYVSEGDLLIRLEESDLVARADQAREQIRAVEARLEEANQNLERAEELHRQHLIAVAQLDAARASADALQAELGSARQALVEAEAAVDFAEIRSPIDGRVVDRFAEPGDTASPGQKLLSLYNPVSLRVEARVREQLALRLVTGDELTVEVPALAQRYTARIEEIVPAADPGSRSFLVKAMLPTARGLLPGMYARLQVPAGERSRLLVPADRVARVGQLDVVWVVAERGADRRIVRLGQPVEGGMLEVLSGLDQGERVLPVP
jgi:RND family efflux transporter MFP subunit